MRRDLREERKYGSRLSTHPSTVGCRRIAFNGNVFYVHAWRDGEKIKQSHIYEELPVKGVLPISEFRLIIGPKNLVKRVMYHFKKHHRLAS